MYRRLAFAFLALFSTPALAQSGLQDGSFETQSNSVSDYCYTTNCPTGAWTFVNLGGFIQQSDTAWPAPSVIDGTHIAFIQRQSELHQSLTASASGNYSITLWLTGRGSYPNGGDQDVIISINGLVVAQYTTVSGAPFHKLTSSSFAMVSGQTYSLSIGTSRTSDSTAFVDKVQLVPASSTVAYSYDALGRLTRVTNNGGTNSGVASTYSLDAAGNRTNVTTTHP